jgi:hypothetical protein
MTKKSKYLNKLNNKPENKIENRKITMGQAYDMFLKQMGGKESTGNTSPCGKDCSEKRCRIACQFLKNKNFDINLHNWDKYRCT